VTISQKVLLNLTSFICKRHIWETSTAELAL